MPGAIRMGLRAAINRYPALLLDTCILIGDYTARQPLLLDIPYAQRRTPLVALWEFLHGREGLTIGRDERSVRRRWLRQKGIIAVDLHPKFSTTFRNVLIQNEGPRGGVDCMIATEGLARGWPVVTHNLADFEDVRGLILAEP